MNANRWIARWSPGEIRAMLLEQFEAFWRRDTGIERERLGALGDARSLPHAVVISGLRRVGKSTLLAQLAHHMNEEAFYYVNFEDERFLGFAATDANDLWRSLGELFGERDVLIIDEIQNVPGWERFVRRFMDMGIKLYITGSNASLLSRELGSRLTGRYVPVELFPFSFHEFLRFRGHDVPEAGRMTSSTAAGMQRHLRSYLRRGGLPEVLTYPELPLARTLYNDVLYRDIAARYRLAEVTALKELAFFLMSNPASPISFNKLKGRLGLGSVNTVKSYIDHLENSWLLFVVNVYDYSVKRQQVAPKKVYAIDTGLANTVGFSFSPNTGHLLENAVFLALRRRCRDVYYYASRDGFEVDFYLPEAGRLIQVTESLGQPDTRAREVRALEKALGDLGLKEGLILTDRPGEPVRVDDKTIEVRSVAEWLLES